jgi:putative transposase
LAEDLRRLAGPACGLYECDERPEAHVKAEYRSVAVGSATFLSILEQTRQRYRFVVVGYVVMPEHVHLLLTEPEVGTPSTVMQVLKQRAARALLPKKKRSDARQRRLFADASLRTPFWQARFYDFNVWTAKKRVEKLRYMHRNPVKRGLVGWPEQWRWSSYRCYLLDEAGPVRVNEVWTKISFRAPAA